jgi:hypothetical protein
LCSSYLTEHIASVILQNGEDCVLWFFFCKTGKAENDRKKRAVRTGRQSRTGRKGHPQRDRQNWTGYIYIAEQDRQYRKVEQKRQNLWTGKTSDAEQVWQNRTPERDRQN